MGRIVVGVDGSPGGEAALRFALAEARLRGATLEAVYAWRLPLYEGVPGPFVVELPSREDETLEESIEMLQERAEQLLGDALRDVLGDADPGVELVPRAVEAAPADALLQAAEEAELLVVGSRGRGAVKELVLGSVSHRCATRAACPVVIVPPAPGGSEHARSGFQ